MKKKNRSRTWNFVAIGIVVVGAVGWSAKGSVLGPKENNGHVNGSLEGEIQRLKAAPNADRITKIVDVTIAYPEGKPLDLQNIVLAWREPCITHVHYRIYDVKDVSLFSFKKFANLIVRLVTK